MSAAAPGEAPEGLGVEWALLWIRLAGADIAENRSRLSELDRAIGDGDHGENMARGFAAVLAKLDAEPAPETVGDVLKVVATTLMSTVGGAAGPLYGTAFLRAAKVAATPVDAVGVHTLVDAALEGIVARGRAQVGDKTMVDAWTPAARAAQEAADDGAAPAGVWAAAASAAQEGAVATEPLVALKGRASYLGERSAGHRDPGAESTALLLAAAARAAQEAA
ncbi:dihydroxyacetone kinase, L subunit [Beutenbergia cavernae DSM 12333]|uniref:Dihydroxyacetone kinase, L subunit n=1 Tax=Beutenbergia cavernae (strain ATCC BAA-8 / DSM 12333 / CCUG 43141 / JCM 11478 / NBRC 16432 / NCIMB 13614 / HKI 0122) TaxID=471853 RepID=C5BWZ3_BEUC1|nr:dihydroxyacetone kinase subunit DhaL [Beutenbergia cavernae]ACQ80809.1 dihydroxyacetone kinase, L subunit [Beutenbergia cavernae DSM 12333]